MKKLLKQKNKNCRTLNLLKGFTLVEVLVATSIFTVSILALMGVLSQGISSTTYAKKKIVAAYLAQEGIEYIRNIRDTYVLYSATSQVGWEAFNTRLITAGCGNLPNGCYFDDQALDYANQAQPMINISLVACGASCDPLLYDSNSGKYGYEATGVNSGFIRKIESTPINANETKIFSTVYWTQNSGTYRITFSESLFNWAE